MVTDDALLPWHAEQWTRLEAQMAADKLPHGILLAGPAQSGKSRLVRRLATTLLCSADNAPCGVCHQCRLVAADTHPDLYPISLLENKSQILVDQIRELIDWASQTAQQSGWKVCIIEPADKMNIQSSNALLKCLEEPPSRTLIILVTDQPNRLLPTLRSRCQRVECLPPARQEAVSWLSRQRPDVDDPALLLDIAGGIPLRAAEFITDEFLAVREKLAVSLPAILQGEASAVQLAADLSKVDLTEVLDILFQLVTDAVGCQLTNAEVCRNRDLAGEINAISTAADSATCFALIDRITEAKGIRAGTSNANAQMLLEWVLSPS
jgi:DNA polymerase-3 subunit delta'